MEAEILEAIRALDAFTLSSRATFVKVSETLAQHTDHTETLRAAEIKVRHLEVELAGEKRNVETWIKRVKGLEDDDREFKKVSRVVALEKENAELRKELLSKPTTIAVNSDDASTIDALKTEVKSLTDLLRTALGRK